MTEGLTLDEVLTATSSALQQVRDQIGVAGDRKEVEPAVSEALTEADSLYRRACWRRKLAAAYLRAEDRAQEDREKRSQRALEEAMLMALKARGLVRSLLPGPG